MSRPLETLKKTASLAFSFVVGKMLTPHLKFNPEILIPSVSVSVDGGCGGGRGLGSMTSDGINVFLRIDFAEHSPVRTQYPNSCLHAAKRILTGPRMATTSRVSTWNPQITVVDSGWAMATLSRRKAWLLYKAVPTRRSGYPQGSVLVGSPWHSAKPQAEWLKPQLFIFSKYWR